MATRPEKTSLTERHRQLLQVLAIAPLGRDVNALLTEGFKFEPMADLVRRKLATVRVETVENRDSKLRGEPFAGFFVARGATAMGQIRPGVRSAWTAAYPRKAAVPGGISHNQSDSPSMPGLAEKGAPV